MKDQTRRPSAYWRPQPDKPLCSEVGCLQPATVWTRRRSFCSHCAPPSALLPAYDQIRAELAAMTAERDEARRQTARLIEAAQELVISIDDQSEWQSGPTQAQYDRQIAALDRLRVALAQPGDRREGEGE